MELQLFDRLAVPLCSQFARCLNSCNSQVDKCLSFLNSFVQQSLENGARPYIPENERSGMANIDNFKSQYQHEASTHGLRFEAYEVPKTSPPTQISEVPLPHQNTELVLIPETSHVNENLQAPKLPSAPDALSANFGAKLRLEGVQKKWGKPTYAPSSTPSSSAASTQKTSNVATHLDGGGSVSSQVRETSYGSSREQVEVSEEKQRLAASLFGASSSKYEKKPPSSKNMPKRSPAAAEKSAATRTTPTSESSREKTVPSPTPPDLLDLSEPALVNTPSVDPFKQLEGLTLQDSAAVDSKAPTLMALSPDVSKVRVGSDFATPTLVGAHAVDRNSHGVTNVLAKKGPNPQDSVEKDAMARHVGVTPTGNNPNLFRDLLG